MAVKEDALTIVLDNESQYFFAGDPVSGRLVVNSTKGVKTNGLSITLHGEIHVTVKMTHSPKLNPENRQHSYWTDETIIDSRQNFLSPGTHELPAGSNSFPFSFHLPHDIPSGMENVHCRIEYSLDARLERSWAIDWTTVKPIPVRGLFDLQPYPALHQPAEFQAEKEFRCLCFASGSLKLWCNLEKTGFYPGELIKFQVKVENRSKKEVVALKAELNQNFIFGTQGRDITQEFTAKNQVTQVIHEKQLPTPMSGEDSWEGELLVPQCDPSGLGAQARFHHFVNLRYTLDIIAQVSGCCKTNHPQVSCDITIGSLPPEQ